MKRFSFLIPIFNVLIFVLGLASCSNEQRWVVEPVPIEKSEVYVQQNADFPDWNGFMPVTIVLKEWGQYEIIDPKIRQLLDLTEQDFKDYQYLLVLEKSFTVYSELKLTINHISNSYHLNLSGGKTGPDYESFKRIVYLIEVDRAYSITSFELSYSSN